MTRRWYDPFTGAPGEGAPGQSGRGIDDSWRSDTPVSVGAVAQQLVSRREWRPRLEGSRIHHLWHRVAGEAVAEHVRPLRLLGGVLVVEVDSGAWATQVRYLSQSLINRANEELGDSLVERIQVTMASQRR